MDAVLSIEPSLGKTVDIEPIGWEKVKILYSVEIHAGVSYLCWKIQDTDQIFKIQATIVYEKHGLSYSDHFLVTLKTFREDFIQWKNEGFPTDWMKRYEKMFSHLIK